jgi:retinol dehydrogenase-13
MEGAQFTKPIKCENKIILITGANIGIGKECALELARRKGIIYMGCRSLERGNAACDEIKMKTGNPNVFVRELDLASFESIRSFVEKSH